MKILNSFLSWVYVKNYEYDSIDEAKRMIIAFSALVFYLFISCVIPSILTVVTKSDYSMFTYLITLICLGGAAAFRIPYMQGKLSKYIPEYIKQQKREYAEDKSIKQNTDQGTTICLHILGLTSFDTINAKKLKEAYRKQAMFWHPDRNKDEHAAENFITVKKAYDILSSRIKS